MLDEDLIHMYNLPLHTPFHIYTAICHMSTIHLCNFKVTCIPFS